MRIRIAFFTIATAALIGIAVALPLTTATPFGDGSDPLPCTTKNGGKHCPQVVEPGSAPTSNPARVHGP